ncbi:MAG: hypothetical protein Q8O82_12970 [Pseudorhodobacter sp.]|nr:hypothetical protein [Pseudorhodobacter sp.]
MTAAILAFERDFAVQRRRARLTLVLVALTLAVLVLLVRIGSPGTNRMIRNTTMLITNNMGSRHTLKIAL